jgi:hypothetical protein
LASQPATTPADASDLIYFLKALPDCRMRRGIRFPQWWMLLVAILAILSGQGSLVGMERFAKRHRQTLNKLLGTDFGKSPSDSTFRLLLAQLDVAGFESLLRGWMTAQPGVAELDTLVCDGKTLRGSIRRNRLWRTEIHRSGEPLFRDSGRGDRPDDLRHRRQW